MKVLYDSTIFSFQIFGGISHYFVELINHLPSDWDYTLPVVASENAYLPMLKRHKRVVPLKYFPDHKKLSSFINRFGDRRELRRGKFDIFHPTDFRDYFFQDLTRQYVITVHDMQFLEYVRQGVFRPEYGECIKRVISHASRIIAISETTRTHLLTSMDVNPDIVDVVYHGFEPSGSLTHAVAGVPERYILFVGQRGNYKNFDVLLRAFSRLVKDDGTLHLVCTGRPFSKGESAAIASAGLIGKVVHKFVRQEDMASLYSNALCFVFPSKMEGFGMPILEAFDTGCPAVLSNASCLPEIGGEGAIYFHPDDDRELADIIVRLRDDMNYRKLAIEYGHRRAKDFSWEKCGIETSKVYEKAL